MYKLIIALCVVSSCLACSKKSIPADSGKGLTPPGYLYEIRKDPYEVIYLRKTSCFGKCPSFEASVMSDGNVKYTGKANVERIGEFQAIMTPEVINNIIKVAFEIKYFEMANQYPEDGVKLADLPTTITAINCTGRSKKISNKHGAPERLKKLEDLIDAELDKLKYTQSTPAKD